MRALVIKELPVIKLHSIIEVEANNGLITSKDLKSCIKLEDIILEGARWQVVKAAEDGNEIECFNFFNLSWEKHTNAWWHDNEFYRIAPEPPQPQYVPFTADDWEMFVGKPVKWADGSVYRLIVEFCSDEVMFDEDRFSYEYALDNFTFLDGSPFGKIAL